LYPSVPAYRSGRRLLDRGAGKAPGGRQRRRVWRDAQRLLKAGGVEVLEVEALSQMDPENGLAKRLIGNPAALF
jgi:hypothetical protein